MTHPLTMTADLTARLPLAELLVVVTGAYGGLGTAVATACAEAGATVVLVGRVVSRLERLYDAIVARGAPEPVIHPMDFATAGADDFAAMARALAAQFGAVHALVHLAATTGRIAPIEHQGLEDWLATFRVDVAAPAALTRALYPLLTAAPAAAVVFTLDTRGEDPRAYWGGYAMAKAACGALFRVLADEWESAAPSIALSAVVPGPMDSPMRRRTHPGEDSTRHPAPAAIAPLYLDLLRRRRSTPEPVDAQAWLAEVRAGSGSG